MLPMILVVPHPESFLPPYVESPTGEREDVVGFLAEPCGIYATITTEQHEMEAIKVRGRLRIEKVIRRG